MNKTRFRVAVGSICIIVMLIVFLYASKQQRSDHTSAISEGTGALNGELESTALQASSKVAVRDTRKEAEQLQKRILEMLGTGDPRDLNRTYNILVPQLVHLNPAEAAAFAQAVSNPEWRHDLMMVVAQSWAIINPDEAQTWASGLNNPPGNPWERDNMVSYVGFSIAEKDLARAVQVLEECKINSGRQEVMVENLAQQWTDRGDLTPLVEWVDKLPPGTERDSMYERVANAQARSKPAEAAAIVGTKMEPGEIQERAALYIIRQWAWNDRHAAANWISEFLPGEMHDRAIKELGDVIARRDGKAEPTESSQ